MKYISKDVVNQQGFTCACWVATEGSFSTITGKAKLKVVGWKDVEAYEAKKPSADNKWIDVELANLQSFESMWNEIAGIIIATKPFDNGIIKDTTQETT